MRFLYKCTILLWNNNFIKRIFTSISILNIHNTNNLLSLTSVNISKLLMLSYTIDIFFSNIWKFIKLTKKLFNTEPLINNLTISAQCSNPYTDVCEIIAVNIKLRNVTVYWPTGLFFIKLTLISMLLFLLTPRRVQCISQMIPLIFWSYFRIAALCVCIMVQVIVSY